MAEGKLEPQRHRGREKKNHFKGKIKGPWPSPAIGLEFTEALPFHKIFFIFLCASVPLW
jgi:hypothetical protein